MRKISGIKYTVTLIILFSCQLAYSGPEISGRLNVNASQTYGELTKYDRAGENRMINEEKLYNFFSVKVTTTNQKKFDWDQDGYLSGSELQEYLSKYRR